jgi:hypothetical protein
VYAVAAARASHDVTLAAEQRDGIANGIERFLTIIRENALEKPAEQYTTACRSVVSSFRTFFLGLVLWGRDRLIFDDTK